MASPPKPISLSDIHDVYRGSAKKPGETEAEQNYRKTDRFSRDAGHSGVAPKPSQSPLSRRSR